MEMISLLRRQQNDYNGKAMAFTAKVAAINYLGKHRLLEAASSVAQFLNSTYRVLELTIPLLLMIFLPPRGGQVLSLHTSFTTDGCKLLIRTDNDIVVNDILPSEVWSELVIIARYDKD
jgi:hypothetical protein